MKGIVMGTRDQDGSYWVKFTGKYAGMSVKGDEWHIADKESMEIFHEATVDALKEDLQATIDALKDRGVCIKSLNLNTRVD